MKEHDHIPDDQRRLLESLNGLEFISSKDAKVLLDFAQENIDATITCCLTCGDQVRRLVRRVTNWWEQNRKIHILWNIEEADIQKLEVPNDILTCEHCQKSVLRHIYNRFHGDKCKMNPNKNG